jgi:hypothetical protein
MDKSRGARLKWGPPDWTAEGARQLSPHTALHILYWLSCLIHYILLNCSAYSLYSLYCIVLHPHWHCSTRQCAALCCTPIRHSYATHCISLYSLYYTVLYCTALATLHCNSMYCTVLMHYSCGMLHSSIIYFHLLRSCTHLSYTPTLCVTATAATNTTTAAYCRCDSYQYLHMKYGITCLYCP